MSTAPLTFEATIVEGRGGGALAYTYRREFAQWVAEAKKPETRSRRAAKAVEKIVAGDKL